jgi:hypothetical protein
MSTELTSHGWQNTNGCLHFSGSVSNVADTPITEQFARTADWKSAMEFCRILERRLNSQREALEAADECLALIEDVGHGSMADNVTVARGIVLAALSQNNQAHL